MPFLNQFDVILFGQPHHTSGHETAQFREMYSITSTSTAHISRKRLAKHHNCTTASTSLSLLAQVFGPKRNNQMDGGQTPGHTVRLLAEIYESRTRLRTEIYITSCRCRCRHCRHHTRTNNSRTHAVAHAQTIKTHVSVLMKLFRVVSCQKTPNNRRSSLTTMNTLVHVLTGVMKKNNVILLCFFVLLSRRWSGRCSLMITAMMRRVCVCVSVCAYATG